VKKSFVMKVLLLDNYDSFTYNLLHYLEMNDGVNVDVIRNDQIGMEVPADYDKIVLSPGPGLPSEAGKMNEIILKYAPLKPILGVCLGMQAMAEVYGGKLRNLSSVMHGVDRPVRVTDKTERLFSGLPPVFAGGRYHSWVVEKETLPDCLHITALDDEDNIMALRHQTYPLRGVQFHPESVLTEFGKTILRNWILWNEMI
jgi:anthranilate synthase component 2